MGMPVDLVLVRHGRSEGNAAKHRARAGETGLITPEFLDRHSSQFRLTDRGCEQATAAGTWIRENIGEKFDRYYVSEYIRAMETAALLNLPNALWFREFYLRERDWGDMDVMTEEDRAAKFAEVMARRERDGLFWIPPNGESLAETCLRIDRVLHTLHREMDGKRVILVCHGETMWCFRVRLERMTQERFSELDRSKDPHDRINNCQILWYSRRNPETGEIAPYLAWMKSVCPSDLSRSRNEWEKIERPRFGNADLLAEVERAPRILNDKEE
jgi:NAD+ kinase